jgi:hypothetical protein
MVSEVRWTGRYHHPILPIQSPLLRSTRGGACTLLRLGRSSPRERESYLFASDHISRMRAPDMIGSFQAQREERAASSSGGATEYHDTWL